ncbi:helix-turn-helix transcriptional regulator [Actibacterium sp. MT2.3-13A]|uniref:helix-turn-helix domain-containing protein n=1 Tax=Actibacterium sp. MT2.3-13A TaxID=2828332 RepID=UPI001BA70B67|nr:helix-turn-helix transcriptional regulator [Actibacterium sp. MT2.3-13A]
MAQVKPNESGLCQKRWRVSVRAMADLENKPYADIAERLVWHRKLLGLDQSEFVEPLHGIKRSAYSNWEAGTSRLSLNGALEIRRVYGLSLDFMYEGIADALPMTLRQAWIERPEVKASK